MVFGGDAFTKACDVVGGDNLTIILNLYSEIPRAQRYGESAVLLVRRLSVQLFGGHGITEHIELRWKR
jgi:hypothetical protein